MTDPKTFLRQLKKNLNILKEREVKYANNMPLELLNQIEDHETAIFLTTQVMGGELTPNEWREALKPLLLAIQDGQVTNIEAGTYVAGDVAGDIVAGDKVVGDNWTFDKQPPKREVKSC